MLVIATPTERSHWNFLLRVTACRHVYCITCISWRFCYRQLKARSILQSFHYKWRGDKSNASLLNEIFVTRGRRVNCATLGKTLIVRKLLQRLAGTDTVRHFKQEIIGYNLKASRRIRNVSCASTSSFFFRNMQKGAVTNNCGKLRQGMAQLESHCTAIL